MLMTRNRLAVIISIPVRMLLVVIVMTMIMWSFNV